MLESGTANLEAFRREGITLDTLGAFEQIARGFAGIPGRKSLVWISRGFPWPEPNWSGGPSFEPMLSSMYKWYDTIWKLLSDANIAIYSVDAAGLFSGNDIRSGLPGLGGAGIPDPRWVPPECTTLKLKSGQEFRDTLKAFAVETGGVPCLNNNDVADCMQRAAKDSETYYMLGFYLPAQERKTGWHRIRLDVATSHTDVRYRKGYLVSDGLRDDVKCESQKEWVNNATYSPLDYTAVPIGVSLRGIEPDGADDRRRVNYVVTLPPGSFVIDAENGNYSDLQVCAIALDQHSKYVTEQSKKISGSLKPETAAKLRALGMDHQGYLELAPGRYQLKFVVRDEITGKMGSVTAPVEVK